MIKEVKEDGETAESFLSGGVDSSYVLAMSDAEVTDSCGYDDERFDESGLAAETAKILGRKNNRCLITPEQYFDIVPYVMYNMEQPLGDASAIVLQLPAMRRRSTQSSAIQGREQMNSSADIICTAMPNAMVRILKISMSATPIS